jgi:DNA-3-methyladenine glycosylase II
MKREAKANLTPRKKFTHSALTEDSLRTAAAELAAADQLLHLIHERHGPPPLWKRPEGFKTLIRIILEQQVSLASAASLYARLSKNIHPFNPECFVTSGEEKLKRLGLTRQKTAYCLHLSESIIDRRIDLRRLGRLNDEEAKTELVKLKGIGSWSADIYLLMALRRPDVWPSGDLALGLSVADLMKLKSTPTFMELEQLAERWRPYRAVAARMLWQHYLAKRARS